MKKLLLTAVCAAIAVSGFSQGYVEFANGITTTIRIQVGTNAPVNATSGTIGSQTGTASTGVLDVGLFYSTATFNTVTGGTLLAIENIGTSAGQLAGTLSLAVPGNSGDTDFFQAFIWDSSYGNTLAGLEACIAADGYFGAASAGAANTAYGFIGAAQQAALGVAPPAAGTPLWGTSGSLWGHSVVLTPTPEPATFALGGIGAAALLLFRRRK